MTLCHQAVTWDNNIDDVEETIYRFLRSVENTCGGC